MDYWFFETVVRLHREWEGAPYTGLKPAGLGVGPVVPRVEKAIDIGNAKELIEFLQHEVKEEIEKRFKDVLIKKDYREDDVDSARKYIQAMLDFTLYSHHLHEYIRKSGEHKSQGEHKHYS